MRIRKLFLSLILVAAWALPAASQTRRVVIRVLDGNNRPVKGVRLHATNTGPVSAPSDRNGLTWILVHHDTQPGESIRIQVMNGPGQRWVLMNPPDDVITVRSFQATESNVVPITVINRRDPQVLINGQLLYSSARRMLRNLGPSSVAKYLTPDQTRAVLSTEARRLGFQHADLARALHDWGATTRDPLQKATAALYEQRFHDATTLLTPLFERQATKTFELATELGSALYHEGAYSEAARKYELATTLRPDDFKAANDLGLSRISLGQYAEAEHLLNLSLDLMRHILDPNDPQVASTLTNKGWLLQTLHKFTDAQKVYDQAFAILKNHFGSDSLEAIAMYNQYGALNQEQGNYKLAKQNFAKALLMFQAKRPLSSAHLMVLINLAAAERDDGELTQSEEHFKVALRLTDQLLRNGTILPNHPIIGQLHNEYYGVLVKRQLFDDAEREITQARDIWANSLGKGHPEFAVALGNLAAVYQNTSRSDLALPLLKQALAIMEQAFGQDHPVTAMRLNNLAECYITRRVFPEAERLLKRALAIVERDTIYERQFAAVCNNLGGLYAETGKLDLAESYLTKAIKAREHTGGDMLEYTKSLINLGDLYRREQRFAEAEELLRKAFRLRDESPGVSTEALVVALAHFGGLFFVEGKYQQAEPYWRRALDLTDRRPTSRNLQIALAQSLNNLGALYRRMGKLDEAEPLLKRAYELWPQLGLEESDSMMRTCGHYSALLNELGRTNEAKTIAAQGETIRLRLSSPKE